MGIEARLVALEQLVDAMAAEIVTRRLVVVDDQGRARLVAEIDRGTAELRLQLPDEQPIDNGPGGARPGPHGKTAVVLYATPEAIDLAPEALGLGPSIGVQLWAGGDSVGDIDAWPDANGHWQPHVHLTGEP